ncbi:hypothetical protein [Mesorhizobium sp. M0199]|uniref:hypothetical protein n=1 Tax=unclassified Mesorhizobium TaxID=325217 RepID=UPI003337DA6F
MAASMKNPTWMLAAWERNVAAHSAGFREDACRQDGDERIVRYRDWRLNAKSPPHLFGTAGFRQKINRRS